MGAIQTVNTYEGEIFFALDGGLNECMLVSHQKDDQQLWRCLRIAIVNNPDADSGHAMEQRSDR